MPRFAVLILMLCLIGCGARTEVAKQKILKQIDSMLGELDVKREEIAQSVTAMKKGIEGLRQAKIKAKVKADQIDRKLEPIEQRIAEIDATLAKIRDPLASGELYEVGGKTYSQAELKALVDDILARRKDLNQQAGGLRKSKESLANVARTLEQKQQGYQQNLTRLEGMIAEIDAKSLALKAMQEASASMGEADATLAENFAALEDKVADLYADVEAGLLSEDEKWNEVAAMQQIDSVDAFINAAQSSEDKLAEIDAILGKTK